MQAATETKFSPAFAGLTQSQIDLIKAVRGKEGQELKKAVAGIGSEITFLLTDQEANREAIASLRAWHTALTRAADLVDQHKPTYATVVDESQKTCIRLNFWRFVFPFSFFEICWGRTSK